MIKISGYLTSCLIVALPDSKENEFNKSVIFICKHDETGAMGFVINQTLEGVFLTDLLQQMEGDPVTPVCQEEAPIFWGGPVEINRGFVLHSLDYQVPSTLVVDDQYGITANAEILKAICRGEKAPRYYMLLLGYAGWQAGQLEKEMTQHMWLPMKATPELIFETRYDRKWQRAFQSLEIEPYALSHIQGEA